METKLYNQEAEVIGTVELPDAVFRIPINADLLHQVVVSQEANSRKHLAHAKGRSEVRGGGIKPWRQKGTGRSRHGSIRSPIWKGGGVTHGPTKEENYTKKINQKVARKALAMALSSKVTDGQIAIVDAITLTNAKTKEMASVLKKISGIFPGTCSLLVATQKNDNNNIFRTSRNIPNVDVIEAQNLNARIVLSRKCLLLLKSAIGDIQAVK